jgi:hypothetical protein
VIAEALVVLAPVAAWMPNTPAGVWAQADLPVTFVLGTPRDGAAEELEVAISTWNRIACTSFRARYGGTTTAVAADDGINVVVLHEQSWPLTPGAVAETIVSLDRSGRIHDADIHLNAKDHRFSFDGAPGTLDLRSVLVHEFGHALGLGHATDARATMFAAGSGVRWRSLEKDDREGVCALYPGIGAAGCTSAGSASCPTGFVCVGGACQRRGERGDLCAPCTTRAACEGAGDGARCVDITGGRVCGRECVSDAECGAGFACRATTAAGDLQCVSLEACRNGASPCEADPDCKDSVCRDGACVGPPEADAGTSDAGLDAAARPAAAAGGAGCDCSARAFEASPSWPPPATSTAAASALTLGLCAHFRRRGRRGRGV